MTWTRPALAVGVVLVAVVVVGVVAAVLLAARPTFDVAGTLSAPAAQGGGECAATDLVVEADGEEVGRGDLSRAGRPAADGRCAFRFSVRALDGHDAYTLSLPGWSETLPRSALYDPVRLVLP